MPHRHKFWKIICQSTANINVKRMCLFRQLCLQANYIPKTITFYSRRESHIWWGAIKWRKSDLDWLNLFSSVYCGEPGPYWHSWANKNWYSATNSLIFLSYSYIYIFLMCVILKVKSSPNFSAVCKRCTHKLLYFRKTCIRK